MKKHIFVAAIMAASFSLTSCGVMGGATGTTSSSTTNTGSNSNGISSILGGISGSDVASAGSSILGNLLGGLLSNTITEQSFVGTWTYQSPQVRFESENLLAQAGGSVVATSIEQKLDTYLSKIGITKGVTTFTFNEDKSFSVSSKGKTILSGTYTYDKSSKTLSMQSTLGLFNQACTVGLDGTQLCLLYDADKLLKVVNTVGSLLGKTSSSLGSIANVFGENFNGMKVGFGMTK